MAILLIAVGWWVYVTRYCGGYKLDLITGTTSVQILGSALLKALRGGNLTLESPAQIPKTVCMKVPFKYMDSKLFTQGHGSVWV